MADRYEAIVDEALFPATHWPPVPAGHPLTVVKRDGFTVSRLDGLTVGFVAVRSVEGRDLDEVVAEARAIVREAGKERAAWEVPEAATPAGLADALRARGMRHYDEPPLEPRHAAMLTVAPPPPGPADVVARLAESLNEFVAAALVAAGAFQLSEEDRRGLERHQELLWEIEQQDDAYRTYVALVDGEVVGSGASIRLPCSCRLAGGSTREDMRGRGVYRALVRARWDDAVRRGTPALTVGAESASRPILERLGFEVVGWNDVLLDDLG